MAFTNAEKPATAETMNGLRKTDRSGGLIDKIDTAARSKKQPPIASIAKGYGAELRVSLTEWRGETKLHLQDATATIPGVFFPAGAGITLAIAKLPELIEALKAAEIEAVKRGRKPFSALASKRV